uniref:pre-rRNA processing protein FTSJ3 n=1 Tax=Scophthalmus maximus TaxID=52904 RepID=A0A8D2ZMK1_SCOMX
MGKKLKVGKTRKDKFYHLAKETGYRSRSSFKLIQLNRKFQFLQKARAVVDLCAAPGVDLVPIKPIPNVVTLQEDITTDKCRQALRKELQTWKVDVVLNDGAPNVGANWQHDAFSQAHLTLMALKLACDFLNKGGTFVTKVFRSKDYQPLLWIFQHFFKKVQATKPQASRTSPLFCFFCSPGFLAPDKIDSKFFDPKHAFKEVDEQAKTVKELIPVKNPKAEGYTDGDLTLYHSFTVTAFLKADNPVDFLSKASEITFDNPDLESHSATSTEIKECIRDIKVLGRKELRLLLSWRSKLRRFLTKKLRQAAKKLGQAISSDEDESDPEEEPDKKKEEDKGDAEDDNEEEELEKKLAELKAEEVADLKRKKRKLLKERRKQRERVELKMDLPGVSIADTNDTCLFSLATIKKKKVLSDISKGDMQAAESLADGEDDIHLSEDDEDDDEADKMSLASDLDDDDLDEVEQRQEELEKKAQKKKVKFAKEEEEEEGQESGLLVELEGKDEKKERETNLWFSKIGTSPNFGTDKMICFVFLLFFIGKGKKRKAEEEEKEEAAQPEEEKAGPSKAAAEESDSDSDDSSDDEKILDAEGLALGCQIATSKKRARDLMDGSFHRFANSEEVWEVPEWFLDDERKHRKKPVPVTREMVEEFKQKWKEIDARPIKRVAEAKARKKRRMLKKMEQAKKKAEAVVNTVDSSEREKMAQLKSIYKKAGLGKEKREVTYVVTKKGGGKNVRRPPGVKGVFKVVDGRMKKDMRGMQRKDQRAKGGRGGKGGKGKGKGRPPKGGRMKGGKGK